MTQSGIEKWASELTGAISHLSSVTNNLLKERDVFLKDIADREKVAAKLEARAAAKQKEVGNAAATISRQRDELEEGYAALTVENEKLKKENAELRRTVAKLEKGGKAPGVRESPAVIGSPKKAPTKKATAAKKAKAAAAAPTVAASPKRTAPKGSAGKKRKGGDDSGSGEVSLPAAKRAKKVAASPATGKGKVGAPAGFPSFIDVPFASAKKINLAVSGYDDDQKINLAVLAKQVGQSSTIPTDVVSKSGPLNVRVTHLVIPAGFKGPRALEAAARGCWRMSAKWVQDSSEKGRWLPESTYGTNARSPIFDGKAVLFDSSLGGDLKIAKDVVRIGGGRVAVSEAEADIVLVGKGSGGKKMAWCDVVNHLVG